MDELLRTPGAAEALTGLVRNASTKRERSRDAERDALRQRADELRAALHATATATSRLKRESLQKLRDAQRLVQVASKAHADTVRECQFAVSKLEHELARVESAIARRPIAAIQMLWNAAADARAQLGVGPLRVDEDSEQEARRHIRRLERIREVEEEIANLERRDSAAVAVLSDSIVTRLRHAVQS